jgi:hypothetical protein
MTHLRRYRAARSLRADLRPAAARAALARVAVGLLLVTIAALLWLAIVTLWAAAAGRAIPPVA